MKKYLIDKEFLVYAGIYLIISIAVLFQPLFNYLGFEFSAAMGALSFILSSTYATRIFNAEVKSNTKIYFAVIVYDALTKNLKLLVIPLVVSIAAMLFVKNCSLMSGLIFYFLIPPVSVIFAVSLTVFVYSLFEKFRKIFLSALILLLLLFSFSEYYFNPQLFVYNPIIGFFPGMIYDEELYLSGSFFLYRLFNLIQSILLLSMANVFFQYLGHKKVKEKLSKIKYAFRSPIALLSAALLVSFFIFRNELGFTAEKGYVTDKLGASYSTENFIIYYSPKQINEKEIKRLGKLHEFYLRKISRELDLVFNDKIESFIYPSAAEKHSLIGAKYTIVAKPWLRQIHINKDAIDEALKHELVHVAAGQFGLPVLRVGRSAALVEGLAMAIEWQWGYRTLHEYSASINKNLPQINFSKIMGTGGFLASNPSVSYVLSGSFIRFLIDNFGIVSVKNIYSDGDFEKHTGKSADLLISEWKGYLSKFHYFPEDSAVTLFTFKRSSIFLKVCARVIANLNEEANSLLRSGMYDKAIELFNRSISLSNSSEAWTGLVVSLQRSGMYDKTLEVTNELLSDRKTDFLPLKLYRADAYWQKAVVAQDERLYDSAYYECSELYNMHLSESYDFASRCRMSILTAGRLREPMSKYYTQIKDDGVKFLYISEIINKYPDFAIGKLLLARLLYGKDEYQKAKEYLEKITDFNIPNYFLAEKYRLLGLSCLNLEDYESAQKMFRRALDYQDNESMRYKIFEMIEFAVFAQK